jgi:NADP-dependent 3-hydroxy acid dehydrogenase YdfG
VERVTTPARVVAVSGASSGIGRAIAVAFGRLGWTVGVGSRREERVRETAGLVDAAGGHGIAHVLDVTDAASVETFLAAVEARAEAPVTAVVNNAATARYGPLEEFSPEEIEREVATKLLGSLYMARRAIRSWKATGAVGDLLFLTSISAVTPWPYHLPYAASGAAVEHAARMLKIELEGSGIRVHTLRCDSTLGTEFADHEFAVGRGDPAMAAWSRLGLLRHMGYLSVDQVAEAVVDAVTLPPGVQYDVYTLTPMAPPGPTLWEQAAEGTVPDGS